MSADALTAPPTSGSVYLVGFMCSGKTTVGRMAAEGLGRPFVDLDARVEAAAGAPVHRLFAERGEEAFRELESRALAAVAGSPCVVATGGGTVMRAANRRLLQTTGFVLWLACPFGVTWERQSGEPSRVRPLWRDEASLRELHAVREPLYAFAHRVIDAADGDAAAVAARVVAAVRGWGGA